MTQLHPFKIVGLSMTSFSSLFTLSDDELATRNVRRCVVDEKPGYPCRVSLVDAEIGETVILLPYVHQPANGPYRSSGPIYVREGAQTTAWEVNEIPPMLTHRLLSVRGYDTGDIMLATCVGQGDELGEIVGQMFTDERIAYLHVHNAGPGCFNCRINRFMAQAGWHARLQSWQ